MSKLNENKKPSKSSKNKLNGKPSAKGKPGDKGKAVQSGKAGQKGRAASEGKTAQNQKAVQSGKAAEPLKYVPHLPVPIERAKPNPTPAWQATHRVGRSHVPLQSIAGQPREAQKLEAVPLATIPTRPVEVQPLHPVEFPGSSTRLGHLERADFREPERGSWQPIRVGPAEIPFEDEGFLEDEDFHEGTEYLKGEDMLEQEDFLQDDEILEDEEIFQDDEIPEEDFIEVECLLEVEDCLEEDFLEDDQEFFEGELGFESESELEPYPDDDPELRQKDAFGLVIQEKPIEAVQTQRVPMMCIPRMSSSTRPVRTRRSAVKIPKNAKRKKKYPFARIW